MWRRTCPSKPGYYWRSINGIKDIVCVKPARKFGHIDGNIQNGNSLAFLVRDHNSVIYVADKFAQKHEWAGPIPEPQPGGMTLLEFLDDMDLYRSEARKNFKHWYGTLQKLHGKLEFPDRHSSDEWLEKYNTMRSQNVYT